MKSKKVLVTGAGGFIGSHLAERCVQAGWRVRVFVHYHSDGRAGWLADSELLRDMEVVAGDIRDYDAVHAACRGVDTVFHLAALIGVPYSYVSPLAYVRTNIEGTHNVLRAAVEHAVANLLISSTSETYGSAQYVPMDERHPPVARSPYAASKTAADQLALSFWHAFDLPVKIVRPFNTYGPRQSLRAIIPNVIAQLATGSRVRVGNTSPTRDFMFVEDTVAGFLAIAGCERAVGEAVNLGTGTNTSIAELIRLIAQIMQVDVEIVPEPARRRHERTEVDQLLCDNSKAKLYCAWAPCHSLAQGLARTVEWVRSNLSGATPPYVV
ncbi:MAG: dTDP-glucose 4,6-dehydratase [Deltaproteobacteria bacterium]|nr:dTDP-glucose 4,6-dehydratase [Deltaproteobacteria bacterium]